MKKARNFFFAAFALGTVAFFSLEGKSEESCIGNPALICKLKCEEWVCSTGAGNVACTAPDVEQDL